MTKDDDVCCKYAPKEEEKKVDILKKHKRKDHAATGDFVKDSEKTSSDDPHKNPIGASSSTNFILEPKGGKVKKVGISTNGISIDVNVKRDKSIGKHYTSKWHTDSSRF